MILKQLQNGAFICNRCSIDLGQAVNLKLKALQSFQCLVPANINNQPKPVQPDLMAKLPVANKQNNVAQTTTVLANQKLSPPIEMSNIANLFKTNKNVTLIKKPPGSSGLKATTSQMLFAKPLATSSPNKSNIDNNYSTQGGKIKHRRFSVHCSKIGAIQWINNNELEGSDTNSCFEDDVELVAWDNNSSQKHSPARPKLAEKRPTGKQAKKTAQKKQKVSNENNSFEEPKGTEKKRYNTRRSLATTDRIYRYWINSPIKGYYIETFNSLDEAEVALDELPEGSTFGPLEDDN